MKSVRQEQLVSSSACSDNNGFPECTIPSISVVIPAYCEEGNLVELHEELTQVLASLKVCWEIILVDDGSTDSTWTEISKLHRRDPKVKGLRFSRNFGHQYAVFSGLSHATGQAVITMDADLQHPPAVIPLLLEEWHKGSKIVITTRIDHQSSSRIRRLGSQLFNKIFAFLSGVQLSPGIADFRLLDRQVVDQMLQLKEGGLFFRGLVQWIGYPTSNVEFVCRSRFSGESKFDLFKLVKYAWSGVTSFSLIPLRVATLVGLLTSVISFSQLVYAVWVKLFAENTVPGWPTIVSIISLLFGILFIQLGIIGEYIGRILEEVRARPRFIISERIGFLHREAALGQTDPLYPPQTAVL